MKPLSIQVLFNTDLIRQLESLNIDYNWDDCIEKEVTIYQIDSIIPLETNNKEEYEYSKIITTNDEFVVRMPYQDLKKIIEINNLA
jgi:hypothetical protein